MREHAQWVLKLKPNARSFEMYGGNNEEIIEIFNVNWKNRNVKNKRICV